MGDAIRLLVIVVAIIFVAIVVAQYIGSLSPTQIATAYLENAGKAYLLYTRDITHDFRLWLAGTRCFKKLPRWVHGDHDEIINLALEVGHPFAYVDDRGADVVARLSCR